MTSPQYKIQEYTSLHAQTDIYSDQPNYLKHTWPHFEKILTNNEGIYVFNHSAFPNSSSVFKSKQYFSTAFYKLLLDKETIISNSRKLCDLSYYCGHFSVFYVFQKSASIKNLCSLWPYVYNHDEVESFGFTNHEQDFLLVFLDKLKIDANNIVISFGHDGDPMYVVEKVCDKN